MNILLVCVLGWATASADTTAWPLVYALAGDFRQLAVDELGQAYTIDDRNELVKYDARGRELFRYNNNTLGRLEGVDVTNPFNLLLFYPAQQTVVLLDRTLNPWSELDLRTTSVRSAAAVGLSRDNNLWVYDDWDFRLKLLNGQGEELLQTDDLRMLLGLSAPPTQLLVQRERVYVVFAQAGVAVFTNFGQFLYWLDAPTAQTLQWAGGQLVLRDQAGYRPWLADTQLGNVRQLPQGSQEVLEANWQGNQVWVRTATGIAAYRTD